MKKKIYLLGLVLSLFLIPPLFAAGTGIGETYTTYKERTTTPPTPGATYDRLYFTSGGPYFVNSAGVAVPIGGGSSYLSDPDVAHGMTTLFGTTVYGALATVSGTIGGLDIYGLTDADQAGALRLTGIIGAADPTDSNAAVILRGGKKNGTGWQALGAAETVYDFYNYTTSIGRAYGNGEWILTSLQNTPIGSTIAAAGTFTSVTVGGAIYWSSATNVLDHGTVTLPTITANSAGHGFVHVSASGAIAESAEFEIDSTGLVQLIRGTANVVANEETMTLDVAAAPADFAVGATITGVTSGKTCTVVSKTSSTVYIVKNRSGAFTLGEVLGDGTNTADQGAANPVMTTEDGKINLGSGLANPVVVTNELGGTKKVMLTFWYN